MIGFVAVYEDVREMRLFSEDCARAFLPGGAIALELCGQLPGSSGQIEWENRRKAETLRATQKNVDRVLGRFRAGELTYLGAYCPGPVAPVFGFAWSARSDFPRLEVNFGLQDPASERGYVSEKVAQSVRHAAEQIVCASPPCFAYVFCASGVAGVPISWDPLRAGRTFGTELHSSTSLLDGYSWIVYLSPRFRERLANEERLTIGYHTEVINTRSGGYLMAEGARQPADFSTQALREWKQSLAPLVQAGPWNASAATPLGERVPWILPEDQG
jgi:hypothetical protein